MKPKLDIFTEDDFTGFLMQELSPQLSAVVANRILNDYLSKNGVEVFLEYGIGKNAGCFGPTQSKDDTHTAILIGITPIEKCTHQIVEYMANGHPITHAKCGSCGVSLKATWQACE